VRWTGGTAEAVAARLDWACMSLLWAIGGELVVPDLRAM